MPPIDPEKLAKAWALATSLHRYAVEKAQQKWRESTPDWPLPETHSVFSVDWYFRTQEFQKRLIAARKSTIQELIAGQIVGLGRPSDTKGIEKISELFWIDAVVDDWPAGIANCDGRMFSDIHIINEADAALVAARKGSKSAIEKSKVKKLTVRAKRLREKRNPKDAGGRPKSNHKIRAMYHGLCKTRPHFQSLNVQKEIAPEIRAAICGEDQRYLQTRGFSDEHIAKIVGQERAKLRKSEQTD